jgi:hypothetical protein
MVSLCLFDRSVGTCLYRLEPQAKDLGKSIPAVMCLPLFVVLLLLDIFPFFVVLLLLDIFPFFVVLLLLDIFLSGILIEYIGFQKVFLGC